jgi:ubiquinone/menaquinone biosynthesis C-methylase UbiE
VSVPTPPRAEEQATRDGGLTGNTGIRPADRVLDVGCGGGQSTRDAARAAVPGSVLGVDVSNAMLERARRRTADEGLENVVYERFTTVQTPTPPSTSCAT